MGIVYTLSNIYIFVGWHVLYVMQFEVHPIKLNVNDLDMHVFVPVWLHIEIRNIKNDVTDMVS